MDSIWTYSTWNPYGVYVESMRIPCVFHVDSIWNAPNISTYSQVRSKILILYETFDQLAT